MIKNIVFDLGNVLVSFKPAEFLEKKGYAERERSVILNEIFRSREWLMLDNGDITTEEAISLISEKATLKRAEIEQIFKIRGQIIFPITSNVKVLPGLKKQGFRLYYLSNFPRDLWEELSPGFDFLDNFLGGMISADAGSSKPDKLIYQLLLSKYSLDPQECLYIDDIEANVEAAMEFGMKGLATYGSESIEDKIRMILREATKQDS